MKRAETQVSPRVSPPVTLAVTGYGDRTLLDARADGARLPRRPARCGSRWSAARCPRTGTWSPTTSAEPAIHDARGSRGYRTELLVEDLVAVLDATVPAGEPVHLVGHDWGSIALWDAVAAEVGPPARRPVASFTSISGPSARPHGQPLRVRRGRLRLLPQLSHSWYVWLILAAGAPRAGLALDRPPRRAGAVLDADDGRVALGEPSSPDARHGLDLYRANVRRGCGSPVARTSVPVQLVVADRDPWVTPRARRRDGARCRRLSRVEVDERHWLPRRGRRSPGWSRRTPPADAVSCARPRAQSATGSPAAREVLGDPVGDLDGGGAGGEDLGHADLGQRRDVLLGDDAAAEDHDVAGVALLEQRDELAEQGHVRPGEHREADRRRRPPGSRSRRSARASGAARCRSPRGRRRAAPGRPPWRPGRGRPGRAWPPRCATWLQVIRAAACGDREQVDHTAARRCPAGSHVR